MPAGTGLNGKPATEQEDDDYTYSLEELHERIERRCQGKKKRGMIPYDEGFREEMRKLEEDVKNGKKIEID